MFIRYDSVRQIKEFYQNSVLANALWFQTVWFTAVFGQNLVIVPLCVLLLIHWYLSDESLGEFISLFLLITPGVILDALLIYFGLFNFPSDQLSPIILVPFWLILLWLAFGATLKLSLLPIITRPLLALFLIPVFAPLSYYTGSRLGAVDFNHSIAITFSVLVPFWIVLTCWMLFWWKKMMVISVEIKVNGC